MLAAEGIVLRMGIANMPMVVVNVGELLECDESSEIATRGCDPCVALIAVYNNGVGDRGSRYVKRCAHFSVGIRLPEGGRRAAERQQLVQTALDPVLTAYFPLDRMRRVGFATGGGTRHSGAEDIVARLRSYFQNQPMVEWNNRDSLRTANDLIIGMDNQHWPFTHDPAHNSCAELNGRDQPFEEKASSKGNSKS
jgi:hypothetical protein